MQLLLDSFKGRVEKWSTTTSDKDNNGIGLAIVQPQSTLAGM
jgi:hypothetical protein